ncbi:MAG: hypothetical protein ACFFCQ_10145 [Promethearchaeota archaeon]
MQKRLTIFLLVTIVLMFLFLTIEVKLTLSITKAEKGNTQNKRVVPNGASLFNFNSSYISDQYAIEDFYPESPHIGRYDIHIQVWVWIDYLKSTSEIIVRNLWNVCDPLVTVSHENMYHQTLDYIYSRPTSSDPDFSVSLEIVDSSRSTWGWVYMMFIDDGELNPPSSSTILPSTCTDTITSSTDVTTNTNEMSTSTSDVTTGTKEESTSTSEMTTRTHDESTTSIEMTTGTNEASSSFCQGSTSTSEKISNEVTTSSFRSGVRRITFPIIFSYIGILVYLVYKNRTIKGKIS